MALNEFVKHLPDGITEMFTGFWDTSTNLVDQRPGDY